MYSTDVSTVRLVDGSGPWDGRLEIKSNGVWGSVCWDNWDPSITDVVCSTLGFQYPSVESKFNFLFKHLPQEIGMHVIGL